jgi:hypothetical protein
MRGFKEFILNLDECHQEGGFEPIKTQMEYLMAHEKHYAMQDRHHNKGFDDYDPVAI